MIPATRTTCPHCGTIFLPERVPGGSCPRCLIMTGHQEEEEAEARQAASMEGWTPGVSPGQWIAPSVEWVQRLLPRYQITALTGQGGMGAVFEARQPDLNRRVAIKLLAPMDFTAEDRPINWFKKEACFLARMNHPGIVQIHDFGEMENGIPYFVMEWVGPVDLAQLITSQGQLAPEPAALLVLQVCTALQYAHELGVVHRDVKPGNLLLTSDGTVKLGDFGMARAIVTTPSLTHPNQTTQLLCGTPDYAAPECWLPDTVIDHRADLYSLGVTFYYLLTGTLPKGNFRSLRSKGLLMAGFDSVIRKAMQQDPAERYQSAANFREALIRLLGQATKTPPQRWLARLGTRRRQVVVLSLASALPLAFITLSRNGSPIAEKAVPLASISVPTNLTLSAPTEAELTTTEVAAALRQLKLANPGIPALTPDTIMPFGNLVFESSDGNQKLSLNDLRALKFLDALRGLALHSLDLQATGVRDITPILQPELKILNLGICPALDLSALRGHPLESLNITDNPLHDLTLIAQPSLTQLTIDNTGITDLGPLSLCPRLTFLSLRATKISDLRPLASLPLDILDLREAQVTDLSPLAHSIVSLIYLSKIPALGLAPLRSCARLGELEINGASYTGSALASLLAAPLTQEK